MMSIQRSTGDGSEGDTDMRGRWQARFGLHPVESELHGNSGRSVDALNSVVPDEARVKQYSGCPNLGRAGEN
jgi:Mn-containing catalase